jgi:hypothetical protein
MVEKQTVVCLAMRSWNAGRFLVGNDFPRPIVAGSGPFGSGDHQAVSGCSATRPHGGRCDVTDSFPECGRSERSSCLHDGTLRFERWNDSLDDAPPTATGEMFG